MVEREHLGDHRIGPDDGGKSEQSPSDDAGPHVAAEACGGEGEDTGGCGVEHRGHQVHAPGDGSVGQPGETVREQGVEGIAGRMGDAEGEGRGDELRAVAAGYAWLQRKQVDHEGDHSDRGARASRVAFRELRQCARTERQRR